MVNVRSEAFAYAYAARVVARRVVDRLVVVPDDTPNIQTAVLAAGLVGTSVYIKPGVYSLRGLRTPIHLPPGVRLHRSMPPRQKIKKARKPPSWMHDGVTCDYHSIIGGPVTAAGVVIEGEPWKAIVSGEWLVRVVGHRGYFAVEAFSQSTKAVA